MKNKTKNQRFLVCPNRRCHSDKRGSHVGVVLSFVIFVTFLVFLYSLLGSKVTPQAKEGFLDYLRLELLERFSTNFTRITIDIDTAVPSCSKLKNLIGEAEIGSNIIVKDSDEEIVDSEFSGNDLIVKSSDDFFKVYYAEYFDGLGSGSESCTELEIDEDYSISLLRTEEYVFEEKVIELIENYKTEIGYENLKEELRIPTGTEFGISFENSEGGITETGISETAKEVHVREIPIQYVDDEANILLGKLNIQIW